MRILSLLFTCLILLIAPAAAQEGLLSPKDMRDIEQILGKQINLASRPSRPLLSAREYLPAPEQRLAYILKRKGKKDSPEIHRITPHKDGQTFTYEVSGTISRQIVDDGAGNAVIVSEIDYDKQVISTFSPPQPLILAGLRPGESRNTRVSVSVAEVDDPSDEKYTGVLDIVYTSLGAYRISTPAGDYEGDLVKWSYEGDIGPADVATTQYRFLAKNAGLVAMVEWRSVSAMLIYHERSRVGRLLSSR